jgi:hypothetical protein
MLHRLAGLALAVLALLVPASVAAAAPVTVNLRDRGRATHLFRGPVTTDARRPFTHGGRRTLPRASTARPPNRPAAA